MTRSRKTTERALLLDAAQRTRETYVFERRLIDSRLRSERPPYLPGPQWDGGRNRLGVRWQPIWPAIVTFAREHEIDPEDLVRCVFDGTRMDKPPLPNQLVGAGALAKYSQVTSTQVTDFRWQLHCQLSVCQMLVGQLYGETDWTQDEILGSVLVDRSQSVSALLRYCIATRLGASMQFAADRCCLEASVQYVRRRAAYDAAWGSVIPDDFRQHAERRYREYLTEVLWDAAADNAIERQQQM